MAEPKGRHRPRRRPRRGSLLLLALASALATTASAQTPLERAIEETAPPEPLPRLSLEFSPDELAKLMEHREQIREKATLLPEDRKWARATLVHDGQRLPARVRIRGDLPVHWRGERISYRVKLSDELYRGMKEINLILPQDKHYGIEVLQTRIAEDLGLPFFPTRFVRLAVNGADLGLYLENEHPTREYLTRTGRTPSSIFTFAAWWTVYYAKPSFHVAFHRPGGRDMPPLKGIAQIKQRATFVRDNPVLARKQLSYALELYRLINDRSPRDIAERTGRYLDLDNFARYLALQDFFGSLHAMELSDNIRLYLDPASGKFEFMPWDTSLRSLRKRLRAGVAWSELLVPDDDAFRVMLGSVPGLDAERKRVLRSLVERGPEYREQLARLHARVIRLYPQNAKLRKNAEGLDRRLGSNIETLEEYFARLEAAPGKRRTP